MEPSTTVHQLRTPGLYPALRNGGIRLYGDTARLTPGLRDAITANRAGIVDALQDPAQSIAYDILDIASCAGWHPTTSHDALIWTRGRESSHNPMPTQPLRDALAQHTADVIRVLGSVPAGCTNRTRCGTLGICAAEIRESACTFADPHRR